MPSARRNSVPGPRRLVEVDLPRLADPQELLHLPSLDGNHGALPHEAAAVGEVEDVEAGLRPVRVDEDDAREVAAEDLPHVRRDGAEELLQVEVREDPAADVEDELQALAAPREPLVRDPEALEARGAVDRERDLVGDDGEEPLLLPGVRARPAGWRRSSPRAARSPS